MAMLRLAPFALLSSLLALLPAASARGEIELGKNSIRLDARNQISLDQLMGESPLTLNAIRALAEQTGDYEGFIRALKLQAPKFFEQPVLLHHSGSLQPATLASPRVILFGRGAMLAFSGNDATSTAAGTSAGSATVAENAIREVEILTFDPVRSRFDAAELRFVPGARRPELEINPPVCAACHGGGDDRHPLWQPYDIWPNLYGSRAGRFTGAEKAEFAKFVKQASRETSGIYAALGFDREGPSSLKLNSPENFTQYVSSLNMLRIMARLREELGASHPARFALAAALNGCGTAEKTGRRHADYRIEEFFPSSLRAAMPLGADELERDTVRARTEMFGYFKAQFGRFLRETDPDFTLSQRLDFESDVVGPARYVLENLGIEWSRFTLSHGENRASIHVPALLPLDLGTALLAYSPGLFAEAQPRRVNQTGLDLDWLVFDCERLKRLSLQALEARPPRFQPLPPLGQRHMSSGLAPMAQCIRCHVHESESAASENAPFIPLDDALALSAWLQAPANADKIRRQIRTGKMPLGAKLESDERDALIEALERIAGSGR